MDITEQEISDLLNGDLCINASYEDFEKFIEEYKSHGLKGGVTIPRWIKLILSAVSVSSLGYDPCKKYDSGTYAVVKEYCDNHPEICEDETIKSLADCEPKYDVVSPSANIAENVFVVKSNTEGINKLGEDLIGKENYDRILQLITMAGGGVLVWSFGRIKNFFCKPKQRRRQSPLPLLITNGAYAPQRPPGRGRSASPALARKKQTSARRASPGRRIGGGSIDDYNLKTIFENIEHIIENHEKSLAGGKNDSKCSHIFVLSIIISFSLLLILGLNFLYLSEMKRPSLKDYSAAIKTWLRATFFNIKTRNPSGEAETLLERVGLIVKHQYNILHHQLSSVDTFVNIQRMFSSYFGTSATKGFLVGFSTSQIPKLISALYTFIRRLLYNIFGAPFVEIFNLAQTLCDNYLKTNYKQNESFSLNEKKLFKEIYQEVSLKNQESPKQLNIKNVRSLKQPASPKKVKVVKKRSRKIKK